MISEDFNKEFFALQALYYMDTDDTGFSSHGSFYQKTDLLRESAGTPVTEN